MIEVDNEQNFKYKFLGSVGLSLATPSVTVTLAEVGWVWLGVTLGFIGAAAGTLREFSITDTITGNNIKVIVLALVTPSQYLLRLNEAKTVSITLLSGPIAGETVFGYLNIYKTSNDYPPVRI